MVGKWTALYLRAKIATYMGADIKQLMLMAYFCGAQGGSGAIHLIHSGPLAPKLLIVVPKTPLVRLGDM